MITRCSKRLPGTWYLVPGSILLVSQHKLLWEQTITYLVPVNHECSYYRVRIYEEVLLSILILPSVGLVERPYRAPKRTTR